MRTYLVTGGAGFIGSNYIHYMFKKYDNEIRIINVDALTYAGNLENLKDVEKRDNYTFVKANICDKPSARSSQRTISTVWYISQRKATWTEVSAIRRSSYRPMYWERLSC